MKNITVRDVYNYINELAPFSSQCEWDNSGMLVGDFKNPVKKIGCVLDITAETVENAKKAGVSLIVSHHPVIFKPVSAINGSDPAYLLAKNGIDAICAHTPLDAAKGGVNDVLAAALGFGNVQAFETAGDEKMMRFAVLDKAVSAEELAKTVATKLSAAVKYNKTANPITKIAFCGGAGGDFVPFVAENGCGALITGEAKHHEMLAAADIGVALIAAGHFETENPMMRVLAKQLAERFGAEVALIEESIAETIMI